MTIQDFDYLNRAWDDIAVAITEDVFGMNGSLTDDDIMRRLANAIRRRVPVTDTGWVRIGDVAEVVFAVWAHKDAEHDRDLNTALSQPGGKEDGVAIKNYSPTPGSIPPLGPGIDIRSSGGYIVAPPSRHISGRRYEFSVDHHPQDTPLAPLPGWLVERLMVRCATPSIAGGAIPEPTPGNVWAALTNQPISEYRDRAALKILGHLFRHNVDYDLARGMLQAWNSAWCKPPLGYHELDQLIDRVATYRARDIERELGDES